MASVNQHGTNCFQSIYLKFAVGTYMAAYTVLGFYCHVKCDYKQFMEQSFLSLLGVSICISNDLYWIVGLVLVACQERGETLKNHEKSDMKKVLYFLMIFGGGSLFTIPFQKTFSDEYILMICYLCINIIISLIFAKKWLVENEEDQTLLGDETDLKQCICIAPAA